MYCVYVLLVLLVIEQTQCTTLEHDSVYQYIPVCTVVVLQK